MEVSKFSRINTLVPGLQLQMPPQFCNIQFFSQNRTMKVTRNCRERQSHTYTRIHTHKEKEGEGKGKERERKKQKETETNRDRHRDTHSKTERERESCFEAVDISQNFVSMPGNQGNHETYWLQLRGSIIQHTKGEETLR